MRFVAGKGDFGIRRLRTAATASVISDSEKRITEKKLTYDYQVSYVRWQLQKPI